MFFMISLNASLYTCRDIYRKRRVKENYKDVNALYSAQTAQACTKNYINKKDNSQT